MMLTDLTSIVGSPNNISHSTICAEADKFGPYYMEGLWGYHRYDIKKSNYQLCFGADPIAANRQVTFATKEWGHMLDHAKVAEDGSRLSSTAQKADEWLPVRPGQDSALALALAHVILVEGLWHRPFVGDFPDGQNCFVVGSTADEKSAIEDAGRIDPIDAQGGEERHRRPAAVRHLGRRAAAAVVPAARRCHICLCPRVVDDDKASGVDALLTHFGRRSRYGNAIAPYHVLP